MEEDVLSYFCNKNGIPALSNSTKTNIASVFRADLGIYTDDARRILTYLPALRRKWKTIPYLTEKETDSIKSILVSEESNLTLRNRTIGMLLFFTGMRPSDISGLRFSNIDWQKEEIRILQRKTGNELVLPLTVYVGNAINDYINMERPKSRHPQIFICEFAPYAPISPRTVGHAADKLYEAAAIRQEIHNWRSAHLFQHNLATTFAEHDIPRPVISATLGHVDPNSPDHYLFADTKHLWDCALSIDKYPIF